jgi:uncharacterized oligopeptide transporter (OPT) family protein
MTFTMAFVIGAFVWLGKEWDQRAHHEVPIGTMIGGLLGTIFSIWLVIRELSK